MQDHGIDGCDQIDEWDEMGGVNVWQGYTRWMKWMAETGLVDGMARMDGQIG